MGISRCRSATSVLKAVLCESETGIVETVKKLSHFSVVNTADKLKSAITFVVSKYNAFQAMMSKSKENNYKGIVSESYFLISDSKKEREKLFEMCQENVIPLWGTSDGIKGMESKFSTEDRIPVFTVATMAPFNPPIIVQTCSSVSLLITCPKNLDDLIGNIGCSQYSSSALIISRKEFNLRRNQLLQEFIDPIGLLKILRSLKKNIQHRGIFKLSIAESQSLLGTCKRSSMTWLISELSSLGVIDYLGSIPTAVHVEFIGPSSAKNFNSAVKDLVAKSQLVCGKYKACPATLMGLSQEMLDKWKQGSATVLTRDDLKKISSQSDRFMEQLGEAKKQGVINLEIKDEALLLQFNGELSEVDIQRLIHKRSSFEEESVSQVINFYSS